MDLVPPVTTSSTVGTSAMGPTVHRYPLGWVVGQHFLFPNQISTLLLDLDVGATALFMDLNVSL